MTTTTTLVLLPVPPPLALQLPHWSWRPWLLMHRSMPVLSRLGRWERPARWGQVALRGCDRRTRRRRGGRPCGGRGWWTALCSGVGQGECVDECGGGDGGLVAWRAPAEATGSASAAAATVGERGGGDGRRGRRRRRPTGSTAAATDGSASAAEATADGVGSGGDQNGGEELQSAEELRRSLDLSGESMVSANGLEPKNGNRLPSKPFHFDQQPNPNQSNK